MPTPILFTSEQAASYLNISPSTLAAARAKNQGPAFVKIGKTVRYSLEALDAFIDSKTVLTDDAVNIATTKKGLDDASF
ncbi:MAG: helix-turn-helix domain-containing protein [Mailhella sp.]|nr:helix-turn-helix domain-containing protein [Mailhella sp.]